MNFPLISTTTSNALSLVSGLQWYDFLLLSKRKDSNNEMTNVFIMFVVFRLVIQLNLLETPLQNLGLNFVRLDGSMSQSQREKSLRLFNENKDIKIFLVSIKAGGLGLNLVAASRVLLLDPWWNRMLIFSILNVQFLF